MSATDILGKIGEKVGGEFSDLRVSLGNLYATKVSLGNVENTIDFSPYATKTSLGTVQTSIANLVSGTNAFTDLKATRAEIGDLTVTGTTTTLNTQTLSVEDNIVEVNLQSDGSETAQTGGIEINRGGGDGISTPTYVGSVTDIQFVKAGDDVTSIRVIDNGVTSDYAVVGGASFLLEAIQGNISLDSAYIDPSNTDFELEVEGDTDGEVSRVFITEQSSGSQTTLANYNFTGSSSALDKAKFIWDDTAGEFKALLGTSATKLAVSEIKVPNSSGVKINNVALGDYSTFESAFNTANS